MRDYRKYQPIPTEDLPAQFAGIFHMLALTFTPANDHTIITTITGHNLELICQGGGDNDRRKKSQSWLPATRKPSGNSVKAIFVTVRHRTGFGVETPTWPTMKAKDSSSTAGIRSRPSRTNTISAATLVAVNEPALLGRDYARGEAEPMVRTGRTRRTL